MEDQVVNLNNGREFAQDDVNTVGNSSGLADDRVLADLFRMTPFSSTASKGVLAYRTSDSSAQHALVEPGTAGARQVKVFPHRAFIGSRTAVGTNAKLNWRDIRSTVVVGSATLEQVVTLAANSSGNPRWDLVYLTIEVDKSTSDTRFLKDPGTKAVAAASYVIKKTSPPTLNVVQGTPAGSPTKPALPADAGANYNIPLAYVRIANAQVTYTVNDIQDVSPVLVQSGATGVQTIRPASGMNKIGGSLLTRIPWPASNERPGPYIPPGMVGGESVCFGLQLVNSDTFSVADGDIIDDSRDWRGRIFRYLVQVESAPNGFVWDRRTAPGDSVIPQGTVAPVLGTNYLQGFAQSIQVNNSPSFTNYFLFTLTHTNMSNVTSPAQVGLWVDAASGALKVSLVGSPDADFFIWLDSWGPYPNL